MSRTKKGATAQKTEPPTCWMQQVGRKPHTVTVFERKDKGLTLWLRWTAAAGKKLAKMSLGFRLRDTLSQRRDAARQAEAVTLAEKAFDRLVRGEDPRDPLPGASASGNGPLTIQAGLEYALRVPGMYAVEDDHWKDMCRYKRHILDHLPSDVKTWEDLASTTYGKLWQALARWRTKAAVRGRTGDITGKRAAELAIVLLSQVGRWLHADKKLTQLPDMPIKKWRKAFNDDWARITGDSFVERDQPRHSPAEMGKLFAGIDAGYGDPRIRLGLRTAGEARLGQALRCDRSALDLSAVGPFGMGRFTIPDRGRKKGAVIDLTPELREAWDFELSAGFLRDLEREYRAGSLRTFPVFPGSRLVRGIAPVAGSRPAGKRAALDWFHELERECGVEVVAGRGWYGIRRIAADLAEDVESDGRALNAITGHTSDETRRKIYQAKRRNEVLARATTARSAARAVAMEAAQQAAGDGPVVPIARAPRAATAPRKPRGPRARPVFAPRSCASCGVTYTPSGANAKQCATCSPRRVRPSKPS